jgi:hypothetical protein
MTVANNKPNKMAITKSSHMMPPPEHQGIKPEEIAKMAG